jgi:hypothetical protein
MKGILDSWGVDPFYLFVVMFIIQIVMIVLYVMLNTKYRRLQKSYGKNLEKSIFGKFDELDEIAELVRANEKEVKEISEKMKTHYQKVGIVKYDAFHEMGGELSFALTMLDENNNGWIFNAMHSREGCYTYIKEVVNGESYIELSSEEKECLEKAVYQEKYDLRDMEE